MLRTGLPVAIKRKDTSELGDCKLIEHEALLLEKLSHPNVAVCLGSFVEGDLYMVDCGQGRSRTVDTDRHRARQHLSNMRSGVYSRRYVPAWRIFMGRKSFTET